MYTLHPDGYNISKSVNHLHLLTYYKFSLNSGLMVMPNRTFDLSRIDYINSMLTTSLGLPLVFLLILIVLYTFHCWLINRKAEERLLSRKRRQLTIQHPHHFPVHTTQKRSLFFGNCLLYYQMLAIGCLVLLVMVYSIYALYDGRLFVHKQLI